MAAAEGSEIEVPSWLDDRFLTEVLRKHHEENDLEVVRTKFSTAEQKSVNLAGKMIRANVQYHLRLTPLTISFIIKIMPEANAESDFCHKEVMVYIQIVPKFEKILRDAGDETVFGPKCIYQTLTPRQVIVMEDLSTQGFRVIKDRFASFEEAEACYEKLAKWHALGYKLLTEEPNLLHEFRYKWISEVMEHDAMTEGLDFFIEVLGNVPTLSKYKPFFETLRPLKQTKVRELFELYNQEPRPAGFYALNHGDFHSRNVMFKSVTEATPHCRILDFQICYLGAPALDILYSLYMLVDAEVRHQKRDELLSHYYKVFVETLEKTAFNGTVPPFDDLKKQILQHRHYELFLLHSFRPMAIGIVGGKFKIAEMFENTEIRREAYNNQAYIDELHITLPKLEKLGLLAIDSD